MADDDKRRDPLPDFCFLVQMEIQGYGTIDTFFKSVGGLKMETEVIPVREGGANNTTFQLVGATKWSNIVLKKGFTKDSSLVRWRQDWIQGTMHRISSGTIVQLNTAKQPQASWTFFNGWPCKWEI